MNSLLTWVRKQKKKTKQKPEKKKEKKEEFRKHPTVNQSHQKRKPLDKKYTSPFDVEEPPPSNHFSSGNLRTLPPHQHTRKPSSFQPCPVDVFVAHLLLCVTHSNYIKLLFFLLLCYSCHNYIFNYFGMFWKRTEDPVQFDSFVLFRTDCTGVSVSVRRNKKDNYF